MRFSNSSFAVKILILLSFFSIFLIAGDSQAQDPEWTYGLDSHTYDAQLSSDGRYIVVGQNGGIVRLLDTQAQTALWHYDTGNAGIRNVDIS